MYNIKTQLYSVTWCAHLINKMITFICFNNFTLNIDFLVNTIIWMKLNNYDFKQN